MTEELNKEEQLTQKVLSKQVERVEKGHWKKGFSGNPNGRKKGGLQKKTQILKTFCDDVLSGGSEKFKNELKRLRGRDYVNAYLALMEYSIPKKLRTEALNITMDENYVKEVFEISGHKFEL